MNEAQKKILDELLLLAHDTPKLFRVRIVAAVVRRNKIISYGFHQNKTHTFQSKYSKRPESIYIHAEIDAIKNALKKLEVTDLSKCDIYIARSRCVPGTKDVQVPGLAKPCKGCQRAIDTFGFKNVFYTINE